MPIEDRCELAEREISWEGFRVSTEKGNGGRRDNTLVAVMLGRFGEDGGETRDGWRIVVVVVALDPGDRERGVGLRAGQKLWR